MRVKGFCYPHYAKLSQFQLHSLRHQSVEQVGILVFSMSVLVFHSTKVSENAGGVSRLEEGEKVCAPARHKHLENSVGILVTVIFGKEKEKSLSLECECVILTSIALVSALFR